MVYLFRYDYKRQLLFLTLASDHYLNVRYLMALIQCQKHNNISLNHRNLST